MHIGSDMKTFLGIRFPACDIFSISISHKYVCNHLPSLILVVHENTNLSIISVALHFSAVRCETFADASSLVILNKTLNCEKKCLAEKETNVNGKNITECFLLQDQTQYLHKDKWKTLSFHKDSLDVVTNKTKVLLKVYWLLKYQYSKD